MTERYELIERIAVGGMAEIFRANKIGAAGFTKPVAVKRILPQLASDPEFVDRFVAEAKISVTLGHPNIVSVFELNRFGESLYIAMEFVDGPDLATLLSAARRSDRPIDVGAALHIAGELLRGLEHAHHGGVIHRDVSPSNVLISRAGEIKITDFGIAKAGGFDLTNNRRVMGKWPYMSPEQADGSELDTRSDLFSAGAVIFELLCGRRLFAGDNTNDIIAAIRSQPIPTPSTLRPAIPPALDRVVALLCERDRERRAAEAAVALEAMLDVDAEISRGATSVAVAAEIERLCPRDGGAGSRPGGLIDDILNSELSHARGGRRVTVQTTRPLGRQTEGMSFVRTDSGGEVGEWVLSDESGTYTLDQTLQMFALPEIEPAPEPEPKPEPPPEPATASSRTFAILAAVVALGIAAAVAIVLLGTREPAAVGQLDAGPDVAIDAAPAPTTASLTITSTPAGAEVRLGGAVFGRTPLRDHPAAPVDGAVELLITRAGYLPVSVDVELVAGARVRINRILQPTSAAAAIDVRSTPPAVVYWRGKRIGRTPLRGLSLPAGEHSLVLVSRDRKLRKEVVVTVPGETEIDVTLE